MNHKTTIAIADDHDLVRDGIISLIHQCTTHTVIIDACNGKELIKKISASSKKPDICIIDINMPEMNGYDTVIELKKQNPEQKILALSMHKDEYCIIQMIRNGANGYLLKSCKFEELLDAINLICLNGYYYSSTASEKAFKVVKNNHLPELNTKELEFLRLCSSNLSYLEISKIMNISVRTLEDYQAHASAKLHISGRIGLALFSVHAGLVPLNKHSIVTR